MGNSGDLKAELLISHHWKLSEIEKAYELFESRKHGALKMLLTNDGPQAPDAKRARTEWPDVFQRSRNSLSTQVAAKLVGTFGIFFCTVISCRRTTHLKLVYWISFQNK